MSGRSWWLGVRREEAGTWSSHTLPEGLWWSLGGLTWTRKPVAPGGGGRRSTGSQPLLSICQRVTQVTTVPGFNPLSAPLRLCPLGATCLECPPLLQEVGTSASDFLQEKPGRLLPGDLGPRHPGRGALVSAWLRS